MRGAMNAPLRIGLVGDPRDEVRAHRAIPRALALAGAQTGIPVESIWLPTKTVVAETLAGLVWCVPGSPYESLDGALTAIRFAREHGVPFLGTCGGFQHAVLEFARNVLGRGAAVHAESSPGAPEAVISMLPCALIKVERAVRLVPGSRLAAAFGVAESTEGYQCSFGVNEAWREPLERSGLRFSAVDPEGAVRGLELSDHPFFLATLFQVELSALSDLTHPLIVAFLRAAVVPRAARQVSKQS